MTEECFAITDWDVNYEVDSDGRAWKKDKKYFQGPLPYIRVKARRDWNVRLLMIRDKVSDDVWTILGVFEKLCQIVGSEPRDLRKDGIIRNSSQQPATFAEITRMLLWPEDKTRWALQVLSSPEVGWIAIPASFAENRELRGKPRKDAETGDESRKTASEQISSMSSRDIEEKSILTETQDVSLVLTDSFRRDYKMKLGATIRCKKPNDVDMLSSVEEWLHENVSSGRAGPEVYRECLEIALDCVKAKSPFGAWYSRVQGEMGYDPQWKNAAA